jgi:chemotaxis signal transduction protein
MVDEVDEVLTIAADQLERVPAAGAGIDAVAKLDDRLVMLLDAEAFASAVEPV